MYKASAIQYYHARVNIIALITDLCIIVSDGMHSADSGSYLLITVLYYHNDNEIQKDK